MNWLTAHQQRLQKQGRETGMHDPRSLAARTEAGGRVKRKEARRSWAGTLALNSMRGAAEAGIENEALTAEAWPKARLPLKKM